MNVYIVLYEKSVCYKRGTDPVFPVVYNYMQKFENPQLCDVFYSYLNLCSECGIKYGIL